MSAWRRYCFGRSKPFNTPPQKKQQKNNNNNPPPLPDLGVEEPMLRGESGVPGGGGGACKGKGFFNPPPSLAQPLPSLLPLPSPPPPTHPPTPLPAVSAFYVWPCVSYYRLSSWSFPRPSPLPPTLLSTDAASYFAIAFCSRRVLLQNIPFFITGGEGGSRSKDTTPAAHVRE